MTTLLAQAVPAAPPVPTTGPVLTADPTWAGVLILALLGLMVAAAMIGLVRRLESDEQLDRKSPRR